MDQTAVQVWTFKIMYKWDNNSINQMNIVDPH